MPTLGADFEVHFNEQRHHVPAEAKGWQVPYSWDARAFWLSDPRNFEAAWRHIEHQIDERYSGVKETATPAEKKAVLAALDREILDAQRREVAAIRALRASGTWVPFRTGTSPLAILNLAGPAPRPNR